MLKHYCDYWSGDCEWYEDGYCWAHCCPEDEIVGPCHMDSSYDEIPNEDEITHD